MAKRVRNQPIRHVDHVFVINLDRRRDRLRRFHQLLPFPATDYVERFPAVDGQALEADREIMELFADNQFRYRRGITGCALSHLYLWRQIADKDYPYGNTAVFEDDVVFAECFPDLWNRKAALFFPEKYDIVYIGGIPLWGDTPKVSHGNLELDEDSYIEEMINLHFGTPKKRDFCTFSYIISKAGAKALYEIAARDGIKVAIDHFMKLHWRQLDVYMSVPLFCWSVMDYSTDIQNDFTSLL